MKSRELKPKDEFMISGKAYKVAMVTSPDYDHSIKCILEPIAQQPDAVRVAVLIRGGRVVEAWDGTDRHPGVYVEGPDTIVAFTINPTTGEVVAPTDAEAATASDDAAERIEQLVQSGGTVTFRAAGHGCYHEAYKGSLQTWNEALAAAAQRKDTP